MKRLAVAASLLLVPTLAWGGNPATDFWNWLFWVILAFIQDSGGIWN